MTYDVLITNFVAMHLSHMRGSLEMPLAALMHKQLEEAVASLAVAESERARCVIVGPVNALCRQGFFGADTAQVRDWMLIQSKLLLTAFYRERMPMHNVQLDWAPAQFEAWLLRNASAVHSEPRILDYVRAAADLEYDSLREWHREMGEAETGMSTLFRLREAQQQKLTKCAAQSVAEWSNTSLAYRQNVCMLYARTPLSANLIARRMRDAVVKRVRGELGRRNVVYCDQHRLMRSYRRLCADPWFIAVHFPALYYVELTVYANIMHIAC